MKQQHVSFISQKLKSEYDALENGRFEDKRLFGAIKRAIHTLKANPAAGIKIPSKVWPPTYVKEHDITNLWKIDLPRGWRLIYTIDSEDADIFSTIIEWFDHKEYERRFGN